MSCGCPQRRARHHRCGTRRRRRAMLSLLLLLLLLLRVSLLLHCGLLELKKKLRSCARTIV